MDYRRTNPTISDVRVQSTSLGEEDDTTADRIPSIFE